MSILSTKAAGRLPQKPGVYLMLNDKEQVIYVGKAKNLRSRVRSYFKNPSNSLKTNFLVSHIHSLDYILTETESAALLLEATLIKRHKPRYNIRLKDDKSYPYIRLSLQDPFPRFYLSRKAKKDGNSYYGPYSGGGTLVRNMIQLLNESFKIRDCSNGFMKLRKTPCPTYQIGFCSAPCVSYVDQDQYMKQVQFAQEFLKGKGTKVLNVLKKEMKTLAERELFEQAAKVKDRIASINQSLEKQTVIDSKGRKDIDIISGFGNGQSFMFEIMNIRSGRWIGHYSHFESKALWQNQKKEFNESMASFIMQYYMENLIPNQVIAPENLPIAVLKKINQALFQLKGEDVDVKLPLQPREKKWMKLACKNSENKFKNYLQKDQNLAEGLFEIQKRFLLPEYPRRIECYDVSHFQSSNLYGSQVVFQNGVKKTSDYRLYKLKDKNDDYESIREVLERRLSHAEYETPQLILVDGGKGQLQACLHVLKKLNQKIPVISIAKAKSDRGFGSKLRVKEKFYIDGRKNPILLDENKKSFQILVQLRNEAHRFAITKNRAKTLSQVLRSELDEVPGIGEKKKIILLSQFKSIKGIKEAGEERVAKIPNIGQKLSRELFKWIKKSKKK